MPAREKIEPWAGDGEKGGVTQVMYWDGTSWRLKRYVKEFFQPATGFTDASQQTQSGIHTGILVQADASSCYINFLIPQDYSSIDAAEAVVLARATDATMGLDATCNIAATGEASTTHSAVTDATASFAATSTKIATVNISSLLSSVAKGDYVGLRIFRDASSATRYGTLNAIILGVRFKYLPSEE